MRDEEDFMHALNVWNKKKKGKKMSEQKMCYRVSYTFEFDTPSQFMDELGRKYREEHVKMFEDQEIALAFYNSFVADCTYKSMRFPLRNDGKLVFKEVRGYAFGKDDDYNYWTLERYEFEKVKD